MKNIKYIFFDNGGTLNIVPPHDDKGLFQIKKIMEILKIKEPASEFQKKIYNNDSKYKKWSLESCLELSEEKIWTDWLLPKYPDRELLVKNASELMTLIMESRGKRTVLTEVKVIFKELTERGYELGIISNTTSKTVVPNKYKEEELADFLKTITLSSITGIRKPDPEIFNIALKASGAKPEDSVYVGDQPNRDMEGPKRANFAYTILVENPEKPIKNINNLPEIQQPDFYISSLLDLLNIFK